ncbi:MAG: nitrate/nitrite transporter [Lautropia sp.]
MRPADPSAPWASGAFGLRLFLTIASGYFMSYGLRSINATIAPELVEELRLGNGELGMLTSAYLLAFAILQLPLGVWLDRYGPRRMDALLMAVAAAGCAVFASASGLAGLWVGRALLGVGFAAGLMAPYALYRAWFAPAQQTRLAAWTLMIGSAGVLGATLPVRAALTVTDWRGVFWFCAALLLTISATMWFGIPRAREPNGRSGQSFLASLGGYGEVGRSPFFWRMALLAVSLQGSFIALQTLWIGPWFGRVLGLTPAQSAAGLFAFNTALMIAFLLVGAVAPRLGHTERSAVRLAGGAAGVNVLPLVLIAAAPAFAGVWAWLLFAATSAVFTPVQARVGMSFPARLAGRALTAFNLIIFVAAFVLQTGLGLLLDVALGAGLDTISAFRLAVAAVVLLQALSWLAFVLWPWSGPDGRPARREDVSANART